MLSRGANPDIQTSRGNLTPLHLACGAGNSAIVELLVRNGCALNVTDSFGSYPIDHAMRNGFTEVAEFLQTQIMKERTIRNANKESADQDGENETQNSSSKVADPEALAQEKFLLQSAFSNLSLKDKLIFNMMVKKRGRSKKGGKGNRNLVALDEEVEDEEEVERDYEEVEVENSSHTEEIAVDSSGDTQMKTELTDLETIIQRKVKKPLRQDKKKSWEAESVESVISETDKESLDIAMKLMNPEVRYPVLRMYMSYLYSCSTQRKDNLSCIDNFRNWRTSTRSQLKMMMTCVNGCSNEITNLLWRPLST